MVDLPHLSESGAEGIGQHLVRRDASAHCNHADTLGGTNCRVEPGWASVLSLRAIGPSRGSGGSHVTLRRHPSRRSACRRPAAAALDPLPAVRDPPAVPVHSTIQEPPAAPGGFA